METLTMAWHPGKGSYCILDGKTYYLKSSTVNVFNEDGVICTTYRVLAANRMEPLVFSVPSVKVRNKENFADDAFLLRLSDKVLGGYMLYVKAEHVGLSEPEYEKRDLSIVMLRHTTRPYLEFETVVKNFADEQRIFAQRAGAALASIMTVVPVNHQLACHTNGLAVFDAATAKLRKACVDAMEYSRKMENYTVQDYLEELEGTAAITCARDAIKAAFEVILDHGYSIEPYTEEGRGECGFEVENWTDNGVDMPSLMDLRLCEPNVYDPSDILRVLQHFIDDFDIDDEIEAHREVEKYRSAFSIADSLEDFTDWLKEFEEMVNAVEVALGPYFELRDKGALSQDEELEDGTFAAILQELVWDRGSCNDDG